MPLKETVLLIEDDHDIRVSFRQILENLGYFIYSVTNGKDALFLLERITPPKLVIVDLAMPIMNGEDFLKEKEAHPEHAKIPVLLVTCFKDRADKLNHYPHLIKPVDMHAFADKVNSCLKPELSI